MLHHITLHYVTSHYTHAYIHMIIYIYTIQAIINTYLPNHMLHSGKHLYTKTYMRADMHAYWTHRQTDRQTDRPNTHSPISSPMCAYVFKLRHNYVNSLLLSEPCISTFSNIYWGIHLYVYIYICGTYLSSACRSSFPRWRMFRISTSTSPAWMGSSRM